MNILLLFIMATFVGGILLGNIKSYQRYLLLAFICLFMAFAYRFLNQI